MTKWHRSAGPHRGCKDTPLRPARLRSGAPLSPPECMDARFSCKCARVEVTMEDGSKGFTINPVEPRYPADHWNVSVAFDRLNVLSIFLSDHHHTGNFEFCVSKSGNRQKRVIDGTQGRAARNDHRGLQMPGEIQHEEL